MTIEGLAAQKMFVEKPEQDVLLENGTRHKTCKVFDKSHQPNGEGVGEIDLQKFPIFVGFLSRESLCILVNEDNVVLMLNNQNTRDRNSSGFVEVPL